MSRLRTALLLVGLATGLLLARWWLAAMGEEGERCSMEGYFRANSYASGKAAAAVDNDPALGAALRRRIAQYLALGGLSASAAQHLEFAYRPAVLLAAFTLTDSDLGRFLSPMQKVANSAAGRDLGCPERVSSGGGRDIFSVRQCTPGQEFANCFGAQYDGGARAFFAQFSWWPRSGRQLSRCTVYVGTVPFHVPQRVVGAPYVVLVDHRARVVYLLAG